MLLYHIMTLRRKKTKENIFVTNEYFEKCGISRQVLRYRLERGKIKAVGRLSGVNLYYQVDADSLILDYWIDNYKKFLKLLESACENKTKKDKRTAISVRLGWKSRIMIEIFEYPPYQNLLPKELLGFKTNLIKYVIFPIDSENIYYFNQGVDDLSKIYRKLFEKFFNEITLRNHRFIKSRLSIDDFIKEDTLNKFHRKSHDEIMGEYEIRKRFKINDYKEIEKYIEEKKPDSNEDVKGFELYEKLKKYYEKLKNKAR